MTAMDASEHLRHGHAQIVRDEEHGQAEPFANIGEQTQHLCLDRFVERGYRLSAMSTSGRARVPARVRCAAAAPPENSCG